MMQKSTEIVLSLAVANARDRHPRYLDTLEMLGVLMEEVGEVAEAIVEKHGNLRIKQELAQVAAVCVRMIEER